MWKTDWLKKSFSALPHYSEKKLKKVSFGSDGLFGKSLLNLRFSIASIKSNYSDIFSFSNKLKFGDSIFAQRF